MKQARIVSVKPVAESGRLSIGWQDGTEDSVDIRDLLGRLKGLAPLRRAATFRRAKVGQWGWSVVWPGRRDIGAETLWRLAREQAGDIMPTQAFRQWRSTNGLTLDGAAQALGLSRRIVAYYDSGTRMIPKTVWLATMGYDSSRRKRAA